MCERTLRGARSNARILALRVLTYRWFLRNRINLAHEKWNGDEKAYIFFVAQIFDLWGWCWGVPLGTWVKKKLRFALTPVSENSKYACSLINMYVNIAMVVHTWWAEEKLIQIFSGGMVIFPNLFPIRKKQFQRFVRFTPPRI